MSNKKKIIVMSALVLLLAVTAVFNFVLANTNALASAEGGVTTANYFTTYRTERSTTRSEELVQLDSVIALYEEGDVKYEEATQMKMEIVAAMEKELVLENLVKSLGFSDAVVSVSSDSDNINVFINSSELTYDTALSIYNMLKNETGVVSAVNSPTVPTAVPSSARSTSSRGTRQAARRNRGETADSRRSCPSAARSSTSRRCASTAFWKTKRSNR